MVYDGKILVTGLRFGNAVVCVQPKRGCAGARCDGQVCKILHDPSVPPPHQYIATYKWLAREFGADAVVHVGTHGNLNPSRQGDRALFRLPAGHRHRRHAPPLHIQRQ